MLPTVRVEAPSLDAFIYENGIDAMSELLIEATDDPDVSKIRDPCPPDISDELIEMFAINELAYGRLIR